MVTVRYSSSMDASQYTVITRVTFYWNEKTDDARTSEKQVYINGRKATEAKQLYLNPATRVSKRNDYGTRETAARYWTSMGTNTPLVQNSSEFARRGTQVLTREKPLLPSEYDPAPLTI
jgi:hypothetical protein